MDGYAGTLVLRFFLHTYVLLRVPFVFVFVVFTLLWRLKKEPGLHSCVRHLALSPYVLSLSLSLSLSFAWFLFSLVISSDAADEL